MRDQPKSNLTIPAGSMLTSEYLKNEWATLVQKKMWKIMVRVFVNCLIAWHNVRSAKFPVAKTRKRVEKETPADDMLKSFALDAN